jgi:hypothetical protein
VRTRVETTVAIELAASWKPLTKSKPSATRTTMTTAKVSMALGQACLRTIDSTTSEMSSMVLRAPSRASTIPFQRRTSSASSSPL